MDADSKKFKNSIYISLSFIVILWFIKYVEFAMHYDFARFGIHPRHLSGVLGIVTGPLIHGDFSHLASNTLPLLILVIGLFYFYQKIALEVILWIYFMTGFWVWIAARGEAYHIGASGLVYGLVSFLFFSGVFRRDTASIAVSLIVVFLYGGMFWGILPISEQISWESHILGAIAGILCSFYFRLKTPIPKFEWQEETEEVGSSSSSSTSTTSTYDLYRNYTYTYTFESSLPKEQELEKDQIS